MSDAPVPGSGRQRRLATVALLVHDYDEAIAFFTGALGFRLVEDTPLRDGKRWVVVAPEDGAALLLAKAVDADQRACVGAQGGGRVFLFLETDDFAREHAHMQRQGVRFVEAPRKEAYGTVAVFLDLYGNRWDLIEPAGEAGDARGQTGPMPYRVLFVCTGNSARSILCEATLNHLGGGRLVAYSAGSRPAGVVNPFALAQLCSRGMSVQGLASKSWDAFTGPDAPPLDLVVTVCDSAAAEPCPVLLGEFARVHWGLPDPARVRGSDSQVAEAFARTHQVVIERLQALVELEPESMDPDQRARAMARIAECHPPPTLPDSE